MRKVTVLLVVATSMVALGCSDSASGPNALLIGTWQTQRASSPPGSYQTTMQLRPDGRYATEVRMFGLYGQHASDLSAYSRYTGRYEVVGDSLRFAAQQYVWWDSFYGANSPEHVEPVQSTAGPHPAVSYTLIEPLLIFRYYSYPADAPVPTTEEFHRLR